MSKKEAFLRARLDSTLKETVENVLDALGITPTQALTMLYKKIARDHAWPIELKIPNDETIKVLDETDQGIGLIESKNADDLFEQLGI